MKSHLVLIPKVAVLRILFGVLGLEVLLFLLPSNEGVEGRAVGYWDGLVLRLSSGKFWTMTLLSGIGAAILLAALVAFSSYMTKFVRPPSDSNRLGGSDKNSID
jgi:hypothetical protein